MVDQRKRRRPEDAEARDGDWYNRNGLAMRRLILAERRFPRLIDCERRNIGTMQRVRTDEHRPDTDRREGTQGT
jgi:hypothetical protein